MMNEDEQIQRTLEIWQPRAKNKLTDDDAREIIRSLRELLSLLKNWYEEDHSFIKENCSRRLVV